MKYIHPFRFAAILILLLLLFSVLLNAVQAAPIAQTAPPGQPAPAQVPDAVLLLIPVFAGGVAVKVINGLKQILGWTADADKLKNIWLSFGVCMAIAILLLLITSSFVHLAGPETFVAWIFMAFSTATLLYKSLNAQTQPAK